MNPLLSELGPIKQICYVVPDVVEAARRHHESFGSGPYFTTFAGPGSCMYRGKVTSMTVDAAFGQWQDFQLEFIKPLGDEPSFLRDVMPVGSTSARLCKLKFYVDDFEARLQALKACGSIAVEVRRAGAWCALIDTLPELGHWTEIAKVTPEIEAFDETIRAASLGFDGQDLIRSSDELRKLLGASLKISETSSE